MLTHICRRCGFKTSFFIEWWKHLLEARHQEETRASFLKWSLEDDMKSLVVYAHHHSSPIPADVTEKFLTLANITDFVFWVNVPRLFIVQLETSDDVSRLLENLRKNPDDMKIGGELIQLRRKSDVLENEWPILVGDGTARAGSTKDPICIVLSDDSDNEEKTNESSANGASNDTSHVTISTIKVENGRDENSAPDHNGEVLQNGSLETSIDEPEFKFSVKMGKTYKETFLSKFKAEKSENHEENTKDTINWMKNKWVETYLEFHNQIWPICFWMGNELLSKNKSLTPDFMDASFRCECLKTDEIAWLKGTNIDDENMDNLIDSKVKEFCSIVMSDYKSKQRMKNLAACKSRQVPLLGFTCRFTVEQTKDSAKSQVTFFQSEGKNLSTKMNIVIQIFKKAFKEYELLKTNKWLSTELEETRRNKNRSVSSSSWTQVAN